MPMPSHPRICIKCRRLLLPPIRLQSFLLKEADREPQCLPITNVIYLVGTASDYSTHILSFIGWIFQNVETTSKRRQSDNFVEIRSNFTEGFLRFRPRLRSFLRLNVGLWRRFDQPYLTGFLGPFHKAVLSLLVGIYQIKKNVPSLAVAVVLRLSPSSCLCSVCSGTKLGWPVAIIASFQLAAPSLRRRAAGWRCSTFSGCGAASRWGPCAPGSACRPRSSSPTCRHRRRLRRRRNPTLPTGLYATPIPKNLQPIRSNFLPSFILPQLHIIQHLCTIKTRTKLV